MIAAASLGAATSKTMEQLQVAKAAAGAVSNGVSAGGGGGGNAPSYTAPRKSKAVGDEGKDAGKAGAAAGSGVAVTVGAPRS